MYSTAEVVEKEYCHARKVSHMYFHCYIILYVVCVNYVVLHHLPYGCFFFVAV